MAVDAADDRQRTVVETPAASRNMGLDPTTHRIFMASGKFTPGVATAANPRPRPVIVPDSFAMLVIER